MRVLPPNLRRQLESAVLEGRRAAEAGVRAALSTLGVTESKKPAHLNEEQARLRVGLRAKRRQLGNELEVLVWECAYEQWHRLLFARFLAENGLLRHPQYGAQVTLEDCEELAADLDEPDAWSVAARFAAEILPGIFRLEDPSVQLRLAPEHRVALERIVAGLPDEVFKADDSLGWVYQYWQKERKDQINASEVKIGGAGLGPVTQLFTENYMVRFLLENSLGAWWAARHPDSPLIKEFEYLRFDDDGQPAAGRFQGWPDRVAEVTVMDPCCGSGHFLVEAFGMLWRMRAEEEGLDPLPAQDAVLRDNLFGLELDPRCVQIAMFAVALTAWKQGGGWRKLPIPNIACSGIPAKAPLEEWIMLADGNEQLERALERLHVIFKEANTLGSLIEPHRAVDFSHATKFQRSFDDVHFEEIVPLLENIALREADDPATAVMGANVAGIARAANFLSGSYSLATTNVPYLTRYAQSERLRRHCEEHFPISKPDLATVFVERCWRLASTMAAVTPQAWMSLGAYEKFRRTVLGELGLMMVCRLGPGAFEAITGVVVNVGLFIVDTHVTCHDRIPYIEAQDLPAARQKAACIADRPLGWSGSRLQLSNPDSRIVFGLDFDAPLLAAHADSLWGLRTADNPRFTRCVWELPHKKDVWIEFQGSVTQSRPFDGRDTYLRWEGGKGALADYANQGLASIQGGGAWGKRGIAVTLSGDLPATLYTGERFTNAVAALWPTQRESDLPALWSFASSAEFAQMVRRLDSKLIVTNKTLLKIPFDVERWRRVADEQYPNGLPEPWSDDPTQWLFEGRPEVATEPLQVAVGRLLGYRWPEQPEHDDLNRFADADGIVCLPAVGGELPAADRLQSLLRAAYGDDWSPALVRQLLEQAGSRKKDLADWLRDDFFKHHCKVFSNRPFVWHIWDGRKDGFSALVNYHRLDRIGLEKLTYTYLGDWIERQRADASEGVAGADVRLAAAQELKGELEAVLEGERPYDIYVRWKGLHEQPIGWDPDLDDGVRLNIRPFVEAGVLRSKVNVHWRKDRGKNPDGSERINDLNYTRAAKEEARRKKAAEG